MAVIPQDSESDARPEVGVVDDSRAIYLAWNFSLREQARIHHFASPEALHKALVTDPTLLDRLRALVIDHRFPNSRQSGVSLARALRQKAPQLRMILSSCGKFSPEEMAAFDSVIGKGPIPLRELIGET